MSNLRFNEWSIDKQIVSKITNNTHLKLKLKVNCKNKDFEYRCIKMHFEEKSFEFYYFGQSPFCIFFHQNSFTYLTILSRLESTFWDKTIKDVSNWFVLAKITQNLEFINLKHVLYTLPIWVFLNKETKLRWKWGRAIVLVLFPAKCSLNAADKYWDQNLA